MTKIYANPYDFCAAGFFFETVDELNEKASKLRNSYGMPVEEFELEFINGESVDAALFNALDIHLGNISSYFEAIKEWCLEDKIKISMAGKDGYKFDITKDTPDQLEADLYEMDSLRELAENFVEEGLYGEIPEALQCYIDYDAIARDLGFEYCVVTVDEKRYVYRGC